MSVRDLIIIGGGPSGLSAAIAAKQRGLDYQVLEQGVLVNSIYRFPPQMVFFTTPELLEIGGLPLVSPYEKPTRAEALRYYRRVVDTYDLQINFDETVLSVSCEEGDSVSSRGRESTLEAEAERSRAGEREPSAAAQREGAKRLALGPQRDEEKWGPASDEKSRAGEAGRAGMAAQAGAPAAMPRLEAEASASVRGGGGAPPPVQEMLAETVFAIETRTSRGVRRARHARHVIFATGYYDHPVMLNVPGEELPHVHHFYGDPHPYYRQRVVIVGGGNSAAEAALELHRAGASVMLVHRGPELKSTIKYWVRPDIENRFKEGAIAARFNSCVQEIRPTAVIISRRIPEAEPSTSSGSSRATSRDESLRSRPRDSEAAGGEWGWGPTSIEKEELAADAVFLLVGYRANTDLFERAGVELNAREGPVYDPETFETNVPGLFVAGGALAGVDTGTIFIENGRFHGEKILEVISRRLK
jgi:thioredoxin reductase (NADPH)